MRGWWMWTVLGACAVDVAPEGGGDRARTAQASWLTGDLSAVTDIAWADEDGDGDLDLAIALDWRQNRIWHNDGGDLAEVWLSGPGEPTRAVAWADSDGDGRLESAFGNGNVNNSGSRSRPEPDRVRDAERVTADELYGFVETATTQDLAWADVTGDGTLELVVVRQTWTRDDHLELGSIEVWDGPIGAMASAFRLEGVGGNALDLADRDGDGDLDLAVGSDVGLGVLDNDGSGSFTLAAHAAGVGKARTVGWHDVDGDGLPEVAVGGDEGLSLLRVEADRTSPLWQVDDGIVMALAWGDVDGDGVRDVVAGGPDGVVGYRADGAELWRTTDVTDVRAVAWADVDGDGDDDLTVAEHWGPLRIYSTGPLAWGLQIETTVSGVGPLSVIVRGGDPGATVHLALGASEGVTALPACGELGITDLLGTLKATVDDDGVATFTPTLPRAAAGTVVWFDAVEPRTCRGARHTARGVGTGLGLGLGSALIEGTTHTRDVALPGDLDGDGQPDLGVGDLGGGAVLLYGREGGADLPFARVVGDTLGGGLAAAGDVDGDGHDDLWVADDDGAHLLHGPLDGDHTTAEATVTVVGASRSRIRRLPEVGDGGAVVLWGRPADPDLGEGAVAIWTDTAPGVHDVEDATAVLWEPDHPSTLGELVEDAGDVNGDGLSDLLVGVPDADGLASGSGEVFVVRAPFEDGALSDVASATLTSGSVGAGIGTRIAGRGDLDGDGTPEVAVRAGATANYVRVVSGGEEGVVDTNLAPLRVTTCGPVRFDGSGAVSLADVDGDGFADLLVGIPEGGPYCVEPPFADFGPPPGRSGDLFVFYGPVEGVVDVYERQFWRGAVGDRLGEVVAVGDVDGDVRDDVLVSFETGAALLRGVDF